MCSEVAISKDLRGRKLFYKYLLFPFANTPVEHIFIKKTDPNSCYRVLTLPRVTIHSNKHDIFDSCIYPQVFDEERWLVTRYMFGESLKVPDLSNELDFCIKAHLKTDYETIENCQVDVVEKTCDKIFSVNYCLSNAKKAATLLNDDFKEVVFYESNVSEVQTIIYCLMLSYIYRL